MAYLNIIFYYKENRTLHLITGAEHCSTLRNLYNDYDKIQVAYRLIELVDKATIENHPHTELFSLLSETLKKLDDATKNFINMLFNFEFNLAKILGFGINTASFELNKNYYQFKPSYPQEHLKGSGIAADGNYHFSEQNLGFLNAMNKGNFDEIMAFNIEKPHDAMLEKFFERHFQYHFENLLITKTKKVIMSQEKLI
jgi:DNA repair protein RecO